MKQHDALARPPVAGDDYVFLALHYQPERATVPMGGQFGDQLMIVEWLLAAIPPGWKLYVKEHPWQLQPFGRGEVQRSSAFDSRLCSHARVVLVRRDAPTAALVRGARAVATVTGSAGWDALCAGIPVLLFGAAWYRDCPGAFEVKDLNGLRTQFERLVAGIPPDAAGVAAFCLALSQVCVPGVLEPELEQAEHLDLAVAASAMSRALLAVDNQPPFQGDAVAS